MSAKILIPAISLRIAAASGVTVHLSNMKNLVDEMHAWYHTPIDDVLKKNQRFQSILSVCFFDSIVVIEKENKNPPLSLAPNAALITRQSGATSFLDMRRMCGIPD